MDSNQLPSASYADALPSELHPRTLCTYILALSRFSMGVYVNDFIYESMAVWEYGSMAV